MQVPGVEELFSSWIAAQPRAGSDGTNRNKRRPGCCSVRVKGVRSVTSDFANPQSTYSRIVIFCVAAMRARGCRGAATAAAAARCHTYRG